MVPQQKCRYSFLFSEFLIVGPVPVEVYVEIISAGRHDGRSVNSQHQSLAGKVRGQRLAAFSTEI